MSAQGDADRRDDDGGLGDGFPAGIAMNAVGGVDQIDLNALVIEGGDDIERGWPGRGEAKPWVGDVVEGLLDVAAGEVGAGGPEHSGGEGEGFGDAGGYKSGLGGFEVLSWEFAS